MKKLILLLMITTPCYGGSVYIDQVGDGNVLYIDQSSSGNSEAILLNKGDNNNHSIIQEGSGDHLAFIGTPPLGKNYDGTYNTNTNAQNNNNNTLTILQSGSGNHTAAINLDATTQNNNNVASITQSGDANKSFVLNLSGSGIGATILQDNINTADSSSMNIQCLTPPCNGYSYTKH
jgi:hypothetical protein